MVRLSLLRETVMLEGPLHQSLIVKMILLGLSGISGSFLLSCLTGMTSRTSDSSKTNLPKSLFIYPPIPLVFYGFIIIETYYIGEG